MITVGSTSKEEKHLFRRNFILSILIIVFFAGIILVYYTMLYHEKRDNILKSGETAAMQSADEFEKYLSTNIDLIKLSSYTLDEMITKGLSDDEIQAFLVGQSTAIKSAVSENSTGLYGYINGRFFSGTNWVPPEGFVATERPWYTRPMEEPGVITIMDPYVDAQSGNVMLALGKSLCDGVSVVSVDVSLDRIQTITEEAVEGRTVDMEMILNEKGVVVSHSDSSEVGKDLSKETGTLNAAIYKHLLEKEGDSFSFNLNGSRYIVYDVEFQNGWSCLTVYDATEVFNVLEWALAATIILVAAVAMIIGILMAKLTKRAVVAENLSAKIASIANIYMTAHEVYLDNDTFLEIKSDSPEVAKLIGNRYDKAQETVNRVMRAVCDESSLDEVLKFVDLSTLPERLSDKDTIALEYINPQKQWRRVRFIATGRDTRGKLIRAMWLAVDIDDEHKEREHLIDMSERAIAASEAKSNFLSNMSHEIRTPINAVLGMNEMILRESEDREILTYAENIKTAGRNLLGIINDILDFSKIEAGKIEIIPVDYDLSSVVNDLVNMIHARADEKGLLLLLDLDKDIPKYLNGDEIRIKQIITNILTNAVKYTEKGSVTLKLKYERMASDPDSIMFIVSVRDTGIGIKKEDMDKLFSEFERIEEKRNRHIEGTGLGMSITKSLLSMMGSSLEVSSVYGEGSEFGFRIKQKVVAWEPLGDYEASYRQHLDSKKKYKEKFTAPKANVLVVDDNPMNLMVFKNLLKQTKVRIDTAGGAAEALSLTKAKKFDLIFLDHMMPEKDGIETLHEIREDTGNMNADTTIVCLTANAISGARDEYLAEGFDDYLSKPVDPNALEWMMITYIPVDKVSMLGSQASESDDREEADDETFEAVEYTADGEVLSVSEKEKEIPFGLSRLEGSGIDVNIGIKNSGKAESYIKVLKVFYEDIDNKINELNGFFDAGDIKNYTIKIHSLKSSARLVGAMDFGETAQMLENAGKAEDLDYLKENHGPAMETCAGLKEALKPFCE